MTMLDLTAIRLEQASAKQAVYLARKAGKLEKPAACSWCGSTAKLEAHHSDYSEPLSVEWLCHPCHKALHIRLVTMLHDLKKARKEASTATTNTQRTA